MVHSSVGMPSLISSTHWPAEPRQLPFANGAITPEILKHFPSYSILAKAFLLTLFPVVVYTLHLHGLIILLIVISFSPLNFCYLKYDRKKAGDISCFLCINLKILNMTIKC